MGRTSAAMRCARRSPLSAARWRCSATTSSMVSRRSNSSASSTSLPASILEKSSTASMTTRSDSPDRWMIDTRRRCLSSSAVFSSSSAVGSTPFMGVRISWLMVARKRDFAWVASSAMRCMASAWSFSATSACSLSRSSSSARRNADTAWAMRSISSPLPCTGTGAPACAPSSTRSPICASRERDSSRDRIQHAAASSAAAARPIAAMATCSTSPRRTAAPICVPMALRPACNRVSKARTISVKRLLARQAPGVRGPGPRWSSPPAAVTARR